MPGCLSFSELCAILNIRASLGMHINLLIDARTRHEAAGRRGNELPADPYAACFNAGADSFSGGTATTSILDFISPVR
jgi:hypothetical protein